MPYSMNRSSLRAVNPFATLGGKYFFQREDAAHHHRMIGERIRPPVRSPGIEKGRRTSILKMATAAPRGNSSFGLPAETWICWRAARVVIAKFAAQPAFLQELISGSCKNERP